MYRVTREISFCYGHRLINYDALPDAVDANIGKPGFVGTNSRGAFSPNTVPDDARQRWPVERNFRPPGEKPPLEGLISEGKIAAPRVALHGWRFHAPAGKLVRCLAAKAARYAEYE